MCVSGIHRTSLVCRKAAEVPEGSAHRAPWGMNWQGFLLLIVLKGRTFHLQGLLRASSCKGLYLFGERPAWKLSLLTHTQKGSLAPAYSIRTQYPRKQPPTFISYINFMILECLLPSRGGEHPFTHHVLLQLREAAISSVLDHRPPERSERALPHKWGGDPCSFSGAQSQWGAECLASCGKCIASTRGHWAHWLDASLR